MYQITHFTDVEDLKYKVASDPTIIKKLAMFAHILGFGWCGGTQTGHVGEGFDISKVGAVDGSAAGYLLKAHYNARDPHAGGYMANTRLSMTLSNFNIFIDPATFVYGRPVVSTMQPEIIDTYPAINKGDSDDSMAVDFQYQRSKTIAHNTSWAITGGITVGAEGKAEVPFVAGGSVKAEVKLEVEHGWEDSESTTYSATETKQYSGTIPKKHRRLITLMVVNTKSEVVYSADLIIRFDVTFNGFLMNSGNARVDHSPNRPLATIKFGNNKLSAFAHILDMYDHRNIPRYSDSVDHNLVLA